jgi:proteasome lid subunit RPN8/RPN11
MSEPIVVQPRNRVKIVSEGRIGSRELRRLAEVPVDSSRRLGDLGQFTPHLLGELRRPPGCEVVILQSVYETVVGHLKKDTNREHGGFLFGYECVMGDVQKPAVAIVDAIPAKFTEGSPIHLTFTTDSWRELDEEVFRRYGDGERVPERVGWYHSHPKINIFLSQRDLDVCRTYERRRYPVALVVDPVRDRGGFFIGSPKGYDSHSPQGFYEAHDRGKDSVVTWDNVVKAEKRVREMPVQEPSPSRGNASEPVIHVVDRAARSRRVALVLSITFGLILALMAAGMGYLSGQLRSQQGEIDALRQKVEELKPSPPTTQWEISIQPNQQEVKPAGQVKFTADVKGFQDSHVLWTIDPRDARKAGTISQDGIYNAPPDIKAPTTVTVRASSVGDANKFGIAIVQLQPAARPAVSVSVNPVEAHLGPEKKQQFQAQITGTENQHVKWTTSGPGTISNHGLYTAPKSVSAATSVTVTATSVADSTQIAHATVILTPATGSGAADKNGSDKTSTAGASSNGKTTSAADNRETNGAAGGKTTVGGAEHGKTASGNTSGADSAKTTTGDDSGNTATGAETPKASGGTNNTNTESVQSLEVSSDKKTFLANDSATFKASSGGAAVSDVIWSLSPVDGGGTIAADGTYTAPPRIDSEQHVLIIATTKDSTKKGEKEITLKPAGQEPSKTNQ